MTIPTLDDITPDKAEATEMLRRIDSLCMQISLGLQKTDLDYIKWIRASFVNAFGHLRSACVLVAGGDDAKKLYLELEDYHNRPRREASV